MKRLAWKIAVVVFFALAFVGWGSDVPTFTCAKRAAVGALIMYLLVRFAGLIMINIIADAIARNMFRDHR